MKTIMLAFREGSENGGPFNSHKRIMESPLNKRYHFVPLIVPRGRMGLLNIPTLCDLKRQIKDTNPDAVQIIGLEMIGFYLALACRLSRINNVIIAIHGSTTEAIEFNRNPIKRIIMRFLEIYTLKTGKITFGVSKYVKTIPNVERYSKNYYGHIYNMLLENSEHIDRYAARKEFGIQKDQIAVVSTGRLTKEKGFDVLLQIMKHYANNDKIVFIIAGDGAYKNTMELELKSQVNSGQVKMLGYRTDITNILSAGDLFVMPSYHETLCMSLMEAGQNGLAMIASRVGGMKEIVDDGETGYLVEPGNANAFIDKIDLLCADSNLRAHMKIRAAEVVAERFSNDKTIKKLLEMYASLLGE